ncbi:MAG TPA: alpha/beta hydrolase, partial [Candidatus Binatia bacterium]
MEKWIGNLLVDASPPEKPKFKAPLILIHGTWTNSGCWQPWSTHFANLGWECWAINFRGRFGREAFQELKRLTFDDCLEDLKRVIRASPFPPVLLAHSLGALVAAKAAEREPLSALVLLSALPPREIRTALPRPLRLLRLKYAPLLWLRRPFRIDDGDFRATWLHSMDESRRREILETLVPESGRLAKDFFDRRIGISGDSVRCPVLVVSGRDDRVAPVESQREMAERL